MLYIWPILFAVMGLLYLGLAVSGGMRQSGFGRWYLRTFKVSGLFFLLPDAIAIFLTGILMLLGSGLFLVFVV